MRKWCSHKKICRSWCDCDGAKYDDMHVCLHFWGLNQQKIGIFDTKPSLMWLKNLQTITKSQIMRLYPHTNMPNAPAKTFTWLFPWCPRLQQLMTTGRRADLVAHVPCTPSCLFASIHQRSVVHSRCDTLFASTGLRNWQLSHRVRTPWLDQEAKSNTVQFVLDQNGLNE